MSSGAGRAPACRLGGRWPLLLPLHPHPQVLVTLHLRSTLLPLPHPSPAALLTLPTWTMVTSATSLPTRLSSSVRLGRSPARAVRWHEHGASGTVPGLLGEDAAGRRCSSPSAPSTPLLGPPPSVGGLCPLRRGCSTQARALEQVRPRGAAEPGVVDRARGCLPRGSSPPSSESKLWAAEKPPLSCAVTATGPLGATAQPREGTPSWERHRTWVTAVFQHVGKKSKHFPSHPQSRAGRVSKPIPAPSSRRGCRWDADGMAVPSPAPREQHGRSK